MANRRTPTTALAALMLLSIALPMASVPASSGNEAIDINWSNTTHGTWNAATSGDVLQVGTGDQLEVWMNASGLAANTDYILGFQIDDTSGGSPVTVDSAQIPFNSSTMSTFSNKTSQSLTDGCHYTMSIILGEDTGGAMPNMLVQESVSIEVGPCGGGGGSGESVSIEGNVPVLGWMPVDQQTIDVAVNDTLETRAISDGLKVDDNYELEVTIYDDPTMATYMMWGWLAMSETSTEYLNYTVPDVCTIGISVTLSVDDGTGNLSAVASTGAQLNVTDCSGGGGGGPGGILTAGPSMDSYASDEDVVIDWSVDEPTDQQEYEVRLTVYGHDPATNTTQEMHWHNSTFTGMGEMVKTDSITIAAGTLGQGCYYASVDLYEMPNDDNVGYDGGHFGVDADCEGEGGGEDPMEAHHMDFRHDFAVDAAGDAWLDIGVTAYLSPAMRNMVDSYMGDGDGTVSQAEADAFVMGVMNDDDDGDDDPPEVFLDGSTVPMAAHDGDGDGMNATMTILNLTGPVTSTEPVIFNSDFTLTQAGVGAEMDHWLHMSEDLTEDEDGYANQTQTYSAFGSDGWTVVDAVVDGVQHVPDSNGEFHLYLNEGDLEPLNFSIKYAPPGEGGGGCADFPGIEHQDLTADFSIDAAGNALFAISANETQPGALRQWIDDCPDLGGNSDGQVDAAEAAAFESMMLDDGPGDGNGTEGDDEGHGVMIDGMNMTEGEETHTVVGLVGSVTDTTSPYILVSFSFTYPALPAADQHTITIADDADPEHDDMYPRTYTITAGDGWSVSSASYQMNATDTPIELTIDAAGAASASFSDMDPDAAMWTLVFSMDPIDNGTGNETGNGTDPGDNTTNVTCPEGQTLNAAGECVEDAPATNETAANTLPSCTTSYSLESTVDMAGTTVDVRHEGGTSVTAPLNGAYTVQLPAGSYWMMVECTDADGDNMTLTITEGGETGETISLGDSFYAETGFVLTDGMVGGGTTITVDWSDGTDNGRMTLTIEVASVDDIVSVIEDGEGGSGIPGFTGLIGVLSLLGAAILAKRKEE